MDMTSPFCKAPFFHSHVTAWGKNSLCCVADLEQVEKTYDADLELDPVSFWNSDYIKHRRTLMLAHQVPPECHRCVKPHTHSVYKDVFDQNFKTAYEELAPSMTSDLTVPWSPRSIDYRNSVCNIQCQTCNPDSSTTVRGTMRDNKSMLEEHKIYFRVQPDPIERSKRTFKALSEFISRGSIREAYFAGGEPTLVPDHLNILKSLSSHAPGKIRLSYNTNLMIKVPFLEKWVEQFDDFFEVYLYCSMDGVGDLGSYIRMGSDFVTFEKNLNYIVSKKKKNLTVCLDITITSLGLFRLTEIANFAISHGVKVNARIMFASIADFLQVEFLNGATRKALCDKYRNFFKTLSPEDKSLVENIHAVLPIIEAVDEFSNQQLHEALTKAKAYAKLYPDFPSFEEWLLKLKDENRSILSEPAI